MRQPQKKRGLLLIEIPNTDGRVGGWVLQCPCKPLDIVLDVVMAGKQSRRCSKIEQKDQARCAWHPSIVPVPVGLDPSPRLRLR